MVRDTAVAPVIMLLCVINKVHLYLYWPIRHYLTPYRQVVTQHPELVEKFVAMNSPHPK